MSISWQQLLEQHGMAQADIEVSEGRAAVAPLDQWCIIRVHGPDAEKFLQGQLSCDLREIVKLGSHLGAHCNIKGHMASLYRVIHAGENEFWLRCHRSNAEAALKLLSKYIIFSKAKAELDDNLVGIGLMGDADALGAQISPTLPTEPDAAISGEFGVIVQVPGERLECWLYEKSACALLPQLLVNADLVTSNAWTLADIRAGLPDLTEATREHFIPQMANMQVYEGVSFSKGCYTGQEIVTRLQHRGILKKAMFRASVAAGELPSVGSAINGTREAIGEVVESAVTADGHIELLAVINKENADTATLTLADGSERQLTLLELPYTLDPNLFERAERPAL